MKKLPLIFLYLSFSLSNFAHANNEQVRKVDLIKNIYKIELGSPSRTDTLKANATPEFRKILNTRDSIHSKFGGEYCDWVRYVYIPGNDSDTKYSGMKFTVLSNGLVRAQGKNFGEKFHRDFKVKCDVKSCKVDDVYDPESYKIEMQQLAKKPYC